MYVTPFGVFACIATVMYSNGVDTMLQLGQVLLALYITFYLYAFIIYGGMVKFFGKYSPIQIFKDIAPAGLNAFGTCSSSATIPISLKCATEKIGIPEEITSLTLPLGITIDMDAVSILMSLMITFFATALGIDLSIGTMVTVLACNVLLSIGIKWIWETFLYSAFLICHTDDTLTALDFKACHLDFSHFVAMQDTLILDMKKCGHTMKSCFGF